MTAFRAVPFDLDETLLDRTASPHAVVGRQAAAVSRHGGGTDRFVRRSIELAERCAVIARWT